MSRIPRTVGVPERYLDGSQSIYAILRKRNAGKGGQRTRGLRGSRQRLEKAFAEEDARNSANLGLDNGRPIK